VASQQIVEEISVNEGEDLSYDVVLGEDTSGETLSAKIRDATATSGTGSQVATAAGAAAGTLISFDLSLSSQAPGSYDLEIIDGSNVFYHPGPNQVVRIVIRDRFSLTN